MKNLGSLITAFDVAIENKGTADEMVKKIQEALGVGPTDMSIVNNFLYENERCSRPVADYSMRVHDMAYLAASNAFYSGATSPASFLAALAKNIDELAGSSSMEEAVGKYKALSPNATDAEKFILDGLKTGAIATLKVFTDEDAATGTNVSRAFSTAYAAIVGSQSIEDGKNAVRQATSQPAKKLAK